MNIRTKYLAIIILAFAVLALGLYGLVNFGEKKVAPKHTTDQKPAVSVKEQPKDLATLVGLGDWLTHDTVLKNAQTNGVYNFDSLLKDVEPLVKDNDSMFCTLPQLANPSKPAAGYPRFNAPKEFVQTMNKFGCNIVGAASNHSFDYDQSYIDGTTAAFSDVKIFTSGMNSSKAQQANNIPIFMVGDMQCAGLSYTTYSNVSAPPQNDYGVNVFSKDLASQQINIAKQKGLKCIVASMRWGTEFSNKTTAQQEELGNWLVGQGVTVVFGHGTHVVQKVDKVRRPDGGQSVILYGLGNFINSQLAADTVTGCVFALQIKKSTQSVDAVHCRPIYNYYSWSAADQKSDNLTARTNFKMLPLSKASTDMFRAQQLQATPESVRSSLQEVLSRGTATVTLEQ